MNPWGYLAIGFGAGLATYYARTYRDKILDWQWWLEDWALKTFRLRTWCQRENDHRRRVWQADCRTAELMGRPPPPPPNRVVPRMDGGL